MSDTSTQVEEGDMSQDDNPNIRQLREKAKRADEAEANIAALQREMAMLKSGIDTESPLGKLFAKGYDGDYTPEALTAAAQEAGIPFKGQVNLEEPVAEEPIEPTGTAERSALADGAPVTADNGEDPRQAAIESARKAIEDGAAYDDAAGHFINQIANAAMAGDRRVIYDERAIHVQRAQQELQNYQR